MVLHMRRLKEKMRTKDRRIGVSSSLTMIKEKHTGGSLKETYMRPFILKNKRPGCLKMYLTSYEMYTKKQK